MRVDGLSEFLDREGFSGVVPNRLDLRFDTASITKLFTSVAVLQLVGQGRLDLDSSIHDHAPSAGPPSPGGRALRACSSADPLTWVRNALRSLLNPRATLVPR